MADFRITQTGDELQQILDNAAMRSELTAETQRAQLAEQANANAINRETERATGKEADLQTLIVQLQNALLNYYLKTETYSAAQIDQMLAAIKQFRYQVVDVLPEPSADTMGIVYLAPSAHAVSGNIKDEWITLSRNEGGETIYYFEQIGDTAVDLSNYSTTAQMNAAIAAALQAYYTKTQVDALIANFITRSVNDLVNYYTKSQTYSQAEINALIAAVKQFRYVSVQTLPTASADTMNVIYLVPSTNPKTQNAKDEFITISATDQGTTTYSWEQIGTTTIDLSDYYTKAQTDAAITAALNTALAAYSTTVEMNAAIASAIAAALADYSTTTQVGQLIATALEAYYTKQEVDALIQDFITASVNNLVNYYLKSETFTKAEVNALIATVKQFRYQSVAELPTASAETVGIIYLVPSSNPETHNVKDEYITLTTTEEEVTTYSWEQIGSTTVDLSGYYTSTQTDAAITAAINAALTSYSTTQQMNAAIVSALTAYYTKQEVDALIANFITNTVNNLVNYYLKSETYTKAEVQALIDNIKQFQYEAVQTLPTASAATVGKIYLVPGSDPQQQNTKDEYITLTTTEEQTTTYSWEKIGSTDIDLASYYTKSQTDAKITADLNAALADYSTTSQMTAAIAAALASYYTKTEVDALIANFITASVNNLVNYYLKSETYTRAEVQQLIDAVKQFTYVSVAELPTASADTMNKIYLVPSTNPATRNVKDEFITISVTDQGTTTYSWEQIGSTAIDLSGYYTSAQTDAAINTALASYSTTTQMNAAIAAAIASYYTKTEVDALIANFITASVNNLVNYYLKSETYTKAEVQTLIDAIKQFTYEVVQTLPTASASTVGKIYLVPNSDPQAQNVKDEYITLTTTEEQTTTYSWEKIGSTSIDLSNYYTKTQTDAAITAAINTALASYSTTVQTSTLISTAITTALASYYNKTEMDTALAGKQATLTFDNVPTANSDNPVKSGGVKTAIDTVTAEVASLHDRIDALFNTEYVGFSVRLNDTAKVMNIIGTAEQLAAFDEWVDESPRPCEVKKDGTDFAYLTNTAGVASNVNWQTRVGGTASKYSTGDKNYLQMVELENVNISVETTGTQLRVLFNFAEIAPEGFHRMFAEPTKLMSRYDLTFNTDGNTLDCTKGTSQPSGTFSFDNLHSMLDATGTDLLNWTAWEIACLAWIQAMRFRTLNVPGSARGRGLQDGSESAARGWVNGTTDTLIDPHGGVNQSGNGGYRFMYMENCTDGKQWLCGFGWRGDNGVAHFTRDDYKANIAATISVEDCEATHDYPTDLSTTYAKNVSELGIATESGGSDSSGFFDGSWSNTSTARIFYAGGDSYAGSFCGPFARAVVNDAANAAWSLRGRCALRKSEVASA